MTIDTSTEQDVVVDVAPYEDVDDGQEHYAHIINPPYNIQIWQPGMSAPEIVEIARMRGCELVALCGYRWVPKRNPDKHPVCKTCMDIAGELMRANNE